jgi:lambda family phage portal protein
MSAFGKVVSFFTGQSATKSHANSMQKRYFSAAKIDRLTSSWFANVNSINEELKHDSTRLRSRGRDLVKNNEYGKKFKSMVMGNVVGPNGFTLQCRVTNQQGKTDKENNDAIEQAFLDWAKKGVCDVTGNLSFNSICRLLIGGMPSDGEFIVRMVRGADAGNMYGFALQCIDVDRLDTQFNRESSANQNAVIMGVEVNQYSKPVAYHILTKHPSNNSEQKRERIPANEIIHGYMVEVAEQVRGIPWMSSAILSLHHLSKFEESAMLAARNGADHLGFFVTPDGTAPQIGDSGSSDEPISVSVPGHYDTLPDGVDYRPHESKYPDAMVGSFIKSFLRRVANGFGVSYNGFASDLESVNFSSIRAGVIEERDQWMLIQNWFNEAFLQTVYTEWLKTSLLNNAILSSNGSKLPPSKLSKFLKHHWQGRRWQWVDPAKDIAAARDSVMSGTLSPQMIAAQTGVAIEDVIEDIRKFEEMTKDIQSISYGDKPPMQQEPNTNLNNEGV